MIKKNQTESPEELYIQLLEKLSPGDKEKSLLDKAYNITEQFIENTNSQEKEKYLRHLFQVAIICVNEMELGINTVLTIFLHDAIRSKYISSKEIESQFSQIVSALIISLCKIDEIGEETKNSQAENFRNFILNLAQDMRVILIKLADILNTIRNAKDLDEKEQYQISCEAFYLYAPLAHRLGLYKIKLEMEDLAMKYTDYENYISIAKRLQETAKTRNRFIKDFIGPIEKRLRDEGFIFEIKGRPKTIYSIWNKMRTKNVEFDDIYDKFAIRIILDSTPENEKSDCWKVYSIITETYQPNPKRLRDWISVPKSNGYESLHTTVVVPGGQWVEVQIRTIRMDEIAEKGFAAHWKYKEGKKEGSGIDNWLANIREFLDSPNDDSVEMVDDFKLSLYSKEIFIFTPRGDLKKLPSGATVLDFAYDIHSNVGDTCIGAKVNEKNVPIRHQLQNGDRVEIITSKNQKPKSDWLKFVITSKAKSKIKLSLKEEMLKEAENGKEIVKRRFKNWKIDYVDHNILKLLKHFKLKTAIDLYFMISTEKIDVLSLKDILTAETEEPTKIPDTEKELKIITQPPRSDELIIDQHKANMDYKLSKCCNPIFGDDVFGFVTISDGIKIHRKNCPNAKELLTKYDYRIVPVKWANKGQETSYQAVLRITGLEEVGLLTRISDIVSKEFGANLRSINLDTNDGMLEGFLKVFVYDRNHLEGMIKKLKSIKGIIQVSRVDN